MRSLAIRIERNIACRNVRLRRKVAGSTLLEVLLAAALFSMGMVALLQLMQSGSRIAMRGELESLAAKRCESVVSLVLAQTNFDLSSLESQLNEDREWETRISIDSSRDALAKLTVVVCRRGIPNFGKFELTRLIPHPANLSFLSSVSTDREDAR